VGRVGRGPNEFTNPGRLVQLRGDTTALVDLSNRRLFLITPAGRPNGTIALPSGAPPDGMQLRVGDEVVVRPSIVPEFIDDAGRIYESASLRGGIDSAALVRADRLGAIPRRLAVLKLPRNIAERLGPTSVSFPVPFSGRDEWTATADGTVIIARVIDYRIEVIEPTGQRTISPPVTFEAMGMTQQDKEQALRQPAFAALPPASVAVLNNRLNKELPESKPPFAGRIHAAPDGLIWVPTSRRSQNDPLVYDVLDRSGRRLARVRMPPRTTIVAFGRAAIYATRADEFDLLYLQRFTLPSFK
ncbi:MAG: hypothetical protein ACREMA_08630, partial [Longimicrobiales bacterium]